VDVDERIFSLCAEQRGSPDGAVGEGIEQRACGGKLPEKRDLLDFRVHEAGREHAPNGLVAVAETEERRTFRQQHVQAAEPFNRAQHDAEANGSLRFRPDGERAAATRQEHAACLG
jgi:hypothetical protein